MQYSFPTPLELRNASPASAFFYNFIENSRRTIIDILQGTDPRILLIIGPCSVHDTQAALEFAHKLRALADEVKEKFFIVMRAYFEKPRTVYGWKGLLYDPYIDGSHDIKTGLTLSRNLLLALAELQLPTATEFLEINTSPYLYDLVTWGCIGARTSTSPPHRQLAATLPLPIGIKNTTDGNVDNPINALLSVNYPHTYLGINSNGELSRISSQGNPHCHLVLRGGECSTNYDALSIETAKKKLQRAGLRGRLVVDCSHDNCNRMHHLQTQAFSSVIHQIREGNDSIAGIMLESYLQEGHQPVGPVSSLQYGVSVTDPCIDWNTTERLVKWGYEQLEQEALTSMISAQR